MDGLITHFLGVPIRVYHEVEDAPDDFALFVRFDAEQTMRDCAAAIIKQYAKTLHRKPPCLLMTLDKHIDLHHEIALRATVMGS